MRITMLIFIFVLSACNAGGTGTGNPFQNGNAAQNPDGMWSARIFNTTCQILEKCNAGVSDAVCANGIASLTGFAPKLGIADNPPPTALDIFNLEENSKLTADSVAADKCIAQMTKMQCNDPVVQSAYVPSAAVPFAGTPAMLDPVCAGVFAR